MLRCGEEETSNKMAKTEELELRIKQLESEVTALRSSLPKRSKISEMSAEVVDSNPYRYYTI